MPATGGGDVAASSAVPTAAAGNSGPGAGSVPATGGDDVAVSSDVPASASATTQARGVDGKVTDEAGRPVTAALVTPTSLDTPSKAIPEVAVFTDDEGAYSWVLPAGRYRITVTADGYHEASGETDVPAGGRATLDLQLRKL